MVKGFNTSLIWAKQNLLAILESPYHTGLQIKSRLHAKASALCFLLEDKAFAQSSHLTIHIRAKTFTNFQKGEEPLKL